MKVIILLNIQILKQSI